MRSYKEVPGHVRSGSPLWTQNKYLCIVICPKKFTLVHNVFEVTELCRTQADILKPTLDRTLVASHSRPQSLLFLGHVVLKRGALGF